MDVDQSPFSEVNIICNDAGSQGPQATGEVTAVPPSALFRLRANYLVREEVVLDVTFHYLFVVFVAGIFVQLVTRPVIDPIQALDHRERIAVRILGGIASPCTLRKITDAGMIPYAAQIGLAVGQARYGPRVFSLLAAPPSAAATGSAASSAGPATGISMERQK
jgi:hypothetical protein